MTAYKALCKMQKNGDEIIFNLMEEVDEYFSTRKKLDDAFSMVFVIDYVFKIGWGNKNVSAMLLAHYILAPLFIFQCGPSPSFILTVSSSCAYFLNTSKGLSLYS